jgi:hypothetical protein
VVYTRGRKGLQVKEAINDTLVSLKFAIEPMLLHDIYKLFFLQAWYLEESEKSEGA